jgi:hypothetical protein
MTDKSILLLTVTILILKISISLHKRAKAMGRKIPDKFKDHDGATCTVISEHVNRDTGMEFVTYKWWEWVDKSQDHGHWCFAEEERLILLHKLNTGKYKRDELCQ